MRRNINIMRTIYHNNELLKKLSLSVRQIDMIDMLKTKKMTAGDIAKKYQISVPNASQQLLNLFDKGYIIREEVTRGASRMYEYTSLSELFERGKLS